MSEVMELKAASPHGGGTDAVSIAAMKMAIETNSTTVAQLLESAPQVRPQGDRLGTILDILA